MKKLTASLIISAMVLTAATAPFAENQPLLREQYSMTAYAQEPTYTAGSAVYTYELTDADHTAKLTSVTTSASTLSIPASMSINGSAYTVTKIDTSFLSGNQTVTTLTMPGTIKEISGGFATNSKLRTLTVSAGVEKIGGSFCANCAQLTTVNYTGTNLTEFGECAFNGTPFISNFSNKKAVVLGDWLIKYDRTSTASSVTVSGLGSSNSIRKIYSNAFWGAQNLTSMNLSGIIRINKNAFYRCTRLANIYSASSVSCTEATALNWTPWFEEQEPTGSVILGKVLLYAERQPGSTCLDLSGTKFQSVEYIGGGAIDRCDSNLKSVKLPKNLKGAAKDAFHQENLPSEQTTSIETIYFYNASRHAYDNLETALQNNALTTAEQQFLYQYFDSICSTKAIDRFTLVLGKRFLQECGVQYFGSPENCSLDAWEQYVVARKIYMHIEDTTEYSYGSRNYKEELLNHKGIVCHSYAELYQYLLGLAGIEAEYVLGDTHAYNIIKIGNTWYNADSCKTWNGCARMFMTTDEAISVHVAPGPEAFPDTCHTRKPESQALPACTAKMGDIDGDGDIDSVDASTAMKIYVGKTAGMTPDQFVRCDVNRDGKTDAVDASAILAYYAAQQQGWSYSFESYLDCNNYTILR